MLTSRSIRSFVIRQGRISAAQDRAYQTLMPRYGIPYQEANIDLQQTFNRDAPKILEIGFGMGETTAQIALSHPHNDYLALEVHTPGVGALLKQIDALQLHNIRIIQHDAVETLQHMITPNSLDGVHIFFPDPWPKKRHHKRRLLQPEFVSLLCEKLKRSAYIHAATDWEEYAQQILTILSNEASLINTAQNFAERPAQRPLTKFEQRGLKLGHGVWDILFMKR